MTTQEDWWRMGFDVAEQHQRYSTIPRRTCVSKQEEIGQEEDTDMLDASEAKRFKSLAATLINMSSERSDVQYVAKEVKKRLKKACRYLKGLEKVTWVIRSW